MKNAQVLDRLLDGEDVPAEQMTEQLRQMAQLADALSVTAADPPRMRAEARTDLRVSLLREAQALRTAPPPLLTRLRERMAGRVEGLAYSARVAGISALAAVVLSGGGVAVAAGSSLPGDVFYSVKIAAERASLAFGDAGQPRGASLLRHVTNRIDEAEQALAMGDEAAAAVALSRADQSVRDAAQQHIQSFLDDGDTEVLDRLGEAVEVVRVRLAEMDLPPGVAGDAAAALGVSLDRIDQRIEVLLTGACTGCPDGVHDVDAGAGDARGVEADGTPPMPPALVDLTIIPAADLPFRACPCVVAPTAPAERTPTTPSTTDAASPPSAPPSAQPPAGGGGSAPGGSSGGADPAPQPQPPPAAPPAPIPGLPDLPPVVPPQSPLPAPIPPPLQDLLDGASATDPQPGADRPQID